MKKITLIFCLLCMCVSLSKAQLETKPTNYVVVGAFSVEKNAWKLQKEIKKNNLEGTVEMNTSRGLYYVHVLKTDDRKTAFSLAKELQADDSFNDAWVFRGILGAIDTEQIPEQGDYTALTEEKFDDLDNRPVELVIIEDTKIAEDETTANEVKKEVPKGVPGFISAINSTNGKVVVGEITVIDLDRTRKMGEVKTNEIVYLESPNNKSGKLLLVSEIFGYRKEQKEFDTNNPLSGEGITKDESGTYQIPIELVRYKKGDKGIMYNVYFFNDAAIMLPESRFEMNSLLGLMNENPNYSIKIHGHTNSKAAGKIISRGKSREFFALNDDNVEGFGSSKELSKDRAQVIKDYLIDNGVDEKRMQVKPWGGKRMIYDKHSPNAKANARVEIEIVKE